MLKQGTSLIHLLNIKVCMFLPVVLAYWLIALSQYRGKQEGNNTVTKVGTFLISFFNLMNDGTLHSCAKVQMAQFKTSFLVLSVDF